MKHPLFLFVILFGIATLPIPALADDNDDVDKVFHEWISDINAGAVDKVTSLYDRDAVLLPTLSHVLRATPESRRAYLAHFISLPDLSARIEESHIRVFGNVAVNSGYYTFSCLKDGRRVDLPARFSFTYLKEPEGWLIVDHHSSRMPEE
jgi:hypothetical protein